MIKTQRETNDDPVKGAKVTMEKATVTYEDYKKFLSGFASAEEAMLCSVKKVEDFNKNVTALIESMGNLFQDDIIPLSLLDVGVDITVHACGRMAIQSHLGCKDSAKGIMQRILECAEEDG